jgi:hypothetical protein
MLLLIVTILALAVTGMSIYYQVKYEDTKRKLSMMKRKEKSYINDIQSLCRLTKKNKKKNKKR